MRLCHSFLAAFISFIISSLSRLRLRGWRRQLVAVLLILSLLSLPMPGSLLDQVGVWAATSLEIAKTPVNFVSAFIDKLFAKTKPKAAPQETMASRAAQVSRIRLSPVKLVAYLGETMTFAAVGSNAAGQTVHGVKFSWETPDSDKLRLDEAGRVTFLQAGRARVIARAGTASAEAQIQIRPLARPRQSDAEWKADQDTLTVTDSASTKIGFNLLPDLLDKLHPTVAAQGTLGSDMAQAAGPYDVGSPRLAALEPTRMGVNLPTSNFNIGIPLVDLGGRGLTGNLTLYYNSNVWGARTDQYYNLYRTFDPIQSFPAPGFSLGFGRIAYYDWQSDPTYTGSYQLMLIDPDGTRHSMGRVWQSSSATTTTTDGTRITYTGSVTGGGTLYYQNGTRVTINFVNNRLLPTQIIEPNGNYLQIAYKAAWQGFAPMAIDSVTDTLGRVISFTYSGTSLTAVTPPSGAGAAFSHNSINLNTNFQNGTVENVGSTIPVITTVYSPQRPALQFTYSGYGMAYQVSWSDNGVNGSVSYNYPTGGEEVFGSLTYSQRTETGTNATTGVYTYGTNGISRPDGSVLKLNGGPTGELKDSQGTTWAKTECTYATDPGGVNQVQSITTYDETNTPTKADFSYDQYGNVTQVRDYGNQIGGQWKVRRRTQTTYSTIALTSNTSSMNLPTRVEVFDAIENTNDNDDVLIKKTEQQYDSTTLTYYYGANPPGYNSAYALTTRGNPTGATEWTDLATNTSVTHTQNLDQFGNVVKAQVSCCNEQNYTYTQNTYWSQPETVTKGNPNSLHLSSTRVYDFNSGNMSSQSDPNNQVTSISYDSSQRPIVTTAPTYLILSAGYNGWGGQTSSTRQFVDNGVTKTVTTTKVYDGFGQVIQEINAHGGQVNMVYNNMGRMTSRSNPFPQGGTPAPATTFQYDALGRTTIVTTPDSNTTQTTYNGKVTTFTDQVNRKSKQEVDSLGRLIKATEQDSSGNLTQETTYSYDLADNLLQVNQGNQYRTFKYDSAGRLIYERIPEQTASINDGTGTLWTAKYTYTTSDKVATRTDARGAITTYTYDDLNRLTNISYTLPTPNPDNVQATPTVTYNYDNNQNSNTKGNLLSVTVGSSYTESYTYSVASGANNGNDVSETLITYTIGSQNYTASFQHTQSGQHVRFGHLYYEYDSRGRLSAVKNSSGAAWMSNLTYNAAGQVTGNTLGNGLGAITETFGYDTNRLQHTSHTATRFGNSVMNLSYGYTASAGQHGAGSAAGNNGLLMSVSGTINGQTESAAYTYDLLGRLATANQTTYDKATVTAQRRFSYDRWGNRTGVWDAVSGGNQIQSISLEQTLGIPTNRISSVTQGTTLTYTYDRNGNVINDGVHSYQYDGENRVVSVDSGTTAQYSYNHKNQRVKKVAGGATIHYVCHNEGALAEYNGATGALLVQYVSLGHQQIAKIESGVTSYFLSDSLSARVVLDGNGNVIGRQTTLPFGEALATDGTTDKRLFTSYERDTESGNDEAWHRKYAYTVGRFNSADPYKASGGAANPQSWNRYSYVLNNPVNLIDPKGLLISHPDPRPPELPTCFSGGTTSGGEETPQDTSGWFPGFGIDQFFAIQDAINLALNLLRGEHCRNGLSLLMDVDAAINDLLLGQIKRNFEDDSIPGAFRLFFNGTTTTHPGVQAYYRAYPSPAVTRGGYPFGQSQIFIFQGFFSARRSGSRIDLLTSQAIVIIHELLHVSGWQDTAFQSNADIDTFIIKACINENWSASDTAF